MSNIYVFLTNSLGGNSGGPSYVNNKSKWLIEHNWEVIAFDSTGLSGTKIIYSAFEKFKNNRIPELYYPPCCFRNSTVERVCNLILMKIPKELDKVVIESNTTTLALWGELLASSMNAKHVIYILEECATVDNDSLFRFLLFKHNHQELFSISKKATGNLFKKYAEYIESNFEFWSANSMVEPINVPFKEFDDVKGYDHLITHFGRNKLYFDNMVEQISIFAQRHNAKKIAFVTIGGGCSKKQRKTISSTANIKLYEFDVQTPIPMCIFTKSDIILATAGCAYIAYKAGAPTIPYNIETNKAMGLLGYDTDEISYSKNAESDIELSECLEQYFYGLRYNQQATLELAYDKDNRGFDYQLECVSHSPKCFYNTSKINPLNSFSKYIRNLALKLGFVSIITNFRHRKYNN